MKETKHIGWRVTFAGLMIIGSVAGMAKSGMGNLAWIVVALMAVGNASGRIIGSGLDFPGSGLNAAPGRSFHIGSLKKTAAELTFQII